MRDTGSQDFSWERANINFDTPLLIDIHTEKSSRQVDVSKSPGDSRDNSSVTEIQRYKDFCGGWHQLGPRIRWRREEL